VSPRAQSLRHVHVVDYRLAGEEGFEPSNAGSKGRPSRVQVLALVFLFTYKTVVIRPLNGGPWGSTLGVRPLPPVPRDRLGLAQRPQPEALTAAAMLVATPHRR
jgi:hypothetical protein